MIGKRFQNKLKMLSIKKLNLNALKLLFWTKAIGLIREIFLGTLVYASSPDAINLYFVSSQFSICLADGSRIALLYLIGIVPVLILKSNLSIIFILCATAFFFWPGILASANRKSNRFGILLLSLGFSILTIAEVILARYMTSLSFHGAPLFSLWVTIVIGLWAFGYQKPSAAIDKKSSFLILTLALARCSQILFDLNFPAMICLFSFVRIAEIAIPQYANFSRLTNAR